jgi:hypothetical protein
MGASCAGAGAVSVCILVEEVVSVDSDCTLGLLPSLQAIKAKVMPIVQMNWPASFWFIKRFLGDE